MTSTASNPSEKQTEDPAFQPPLMDKIEFQPHKRKELRRMSEMAEISLMASYSKERNKKVTAICSGLVMDSGSLPSSDVAKSRQWVSPSE